VFDEFLIFFPQVRAEVWADHCLFAALRLQMPPKAFLPRTMRFFERRFFAVDLISLYWLA
jgi:hypothetical protein